MNGQTNSLIPFAFGDNLVRSFLDDTGNPWFVAKDVCSILEIQNPSDTVRKVLDEDEKGVATIYTLGGNQEVLTISEPGLYSLVFRSRKPEAKAFSKWVRSEVLPSLRKTGTYTMPNEARKHVETPEPLRRILPPEIDLPEEALQLRPGMRIRLWQDSLQSARLEGADMAYAVECFVKLCTVMAQKPTPVPNDEQNGILDFADSCCEPVTQNRLRASRLYSAFCRWWQQRHDEPAPSIHVFGRTFGRRYRREKRGGQAYYLDVRLAQ